MYVMKKTIAGDYIKIQKYTPHNLAAHRKPRGKRANETSTAVKNYNQRLRAEKLQMLIILNFKNGYLVTLEYHKGSSPQSYQAADKLLMKTLKAIKRKHADDFKYIAITERGTETHGLHHHVIVSSIDAALELGSAWDGYHDYKQLYDEGAYKNLAEYLTKQETKEEKPRGGSAYHASRNLAKPSIEYQIVNDTWDEKPTPPEGYEMIPESLKNGFNDVIGIKYQSYMLKRQISPPEHQKIRTQRKHERTRLKNISRAAHIIGRGFMNVGNCLRIAKAAGHNQKNYINLASNRKGNEGKGSEK